MNYTYEDIVDLPLPKKHAKEFSRRLVEAGVIRTARPNISVKGLLHMFSNQAYRETGEYVLADNSRDRAILALTSKPSASTKEKVLKAWLETIEGIPKVERALLGWSKV